LNIALLLQFILRLHRNHGRRIIDSTIRVLRRDRDVGALQVLQGDEVRQVLAESILDVRDGTPCGSLERGRAFFHGRIKQLGQDRDDFLLLLTRRLGRNVCRSLCSGDCIIGRRPVAQFPNSSQYSLALGWRQLLQQSDQTLSLLFELRFGSIFSMCHGLLSPSPSPSQCQPLFVSGAPTTVSLGIGK